MPSPLPTACLSEAIENTWPGNIQNQFPQLFLPLSCGDIASKNKLRKTARDSLPGEPFPPAPVQSSRAAARLGRL